MLVYFIVYITLAVSSLIWLWGNWLSSRTRSPGFGEGVRDLLLELGMSCSYCVYTLASRSRKLYTGVTSNLERRMVEHRQGLIPGFTVRYRIFRLVHFEEFGDVRDAVAREKEIKGWRREKKILMFERSNPTWADLAERLPGKGRMDEGQAGVQYRAKAAAGKADPSPRPPEAGDRSSG